MQKQFAEEVIKAITKLIDQPTAYAIRYKNFRIVHTRIFPYGVHFYIDEALKTVVITAVIHNFRKADFGKEEE